MDANIKLGKIFDIPIGLHVSWFLIFFLLTWSLALGYFPDTYPEFSRLIHVLLAVVTSLLFFGSVVAHELGHSLVAIREKIPVKSITLFIFGGVAQIGQEPRSPGAEFRIAIAGPIVSLGLALMFGGLWLLDRTIPYLSAPSEYLMRINFILAVFNLIPGFPLDGGRVLRSIVWWWTKNFQQATKVAAFSGQLIAFGFIAVGVFTIFQGNFMNGLWLAFIGWFLQNAAATSYAQTTMQNNLRGVKVSQVMNRDCITVPSLISLKQLVDERVLNGGQRCFVVADNGKLQGLLTLKDISSVPQNKWRFTTTQQAMVPFNRLEQVTPETELMTALQILDNANINQVPVVENGELIGMLSRDHVLHYLRVRAELGL